MTPHKYEIFDYFLACEFLVEIDSWYLTVRRQKTPLETITKTLQIYRKSFVCVIVFSKGDFVRFL